jgi:hypothetical protein
MFSNLWLDDVLRRALNPSLPNMQNTDGEPLATSSGSLRRRRRASPTLRAPKSPCRRRSRQTLLRNRPVREWAAVIVAGFAIFPETLLVLFAGENFGKLVLQIADV